MGVKGIIKPADFDNLSQADLQALATTQYASQVVTVDGPFRFNFFGKITNVGGGAAGEAKLTIASVDDAGAVVKSLDIVTGIATNVVGESLVDLTFGAGGDAVLFGAGSLSANANMFQVVYALQFTIEVVTANDGTSSVFDGWLFTTK